MQVGFVETMRGALRPMSPAPEASATGATELPCSFTVAVAAPSVRALVRSGRTRAAGVVRAAPWAAEAPCDGEIVLSVRPARIAYSIAFASNAGERLVLSGHKSVRAHHLLASMTTLPMTLVVAQGARAGAELARGTLFFDLRDLLPFARSWLPVPARERAALAHARMRLLRAGLEA
jgi:hypothetical protein